METTRSKPLRFYFALPRLLAKITGGDARRSENNGFEAWIVSVATYLICYLFFATRLVPALRPLWLQIFVSLLLFFAVWFLWVFILHVDAFLIKLIRSSGILRDLPIRRAQSILIMSLSSALAYSLVMAGSIVSVAALVWLAAVVLNISAAMVLRLTHD
ncbi:MAG: hypothetical protein ABJB09_01165 [Verrucomicrobiota bacterium]